MRVPGTPPSAEIPHDPRKIYQQESQCEGREEAEHFARPEAASEEQEGNPGKRDQQDHLVHQKENAQGRAGERAAPSNGPTSLDQVGGAEEEQDESELGEIRVPTRHELRRSDREHARGNSGAVVPHNMVETCGSRAAARAFTIRLATRTAVMKLKDGGRVSQTQKARNSG